MVVRAPRDQGGPSAGLFAVALSAMVAFGQSMSFGFVYDDHWTVEGNRALDLPLATLVRTLLLGRGVARGIPDATRPTMVTSLWLDRRLFGSDSSGYHLHSAVLYSLCCVLATCAIFAVTRRRGAALAGGLLFAVSPIHAEVVCSVNYREDLEAGAAVFALVAWLFWPRRSDSVDHAVLAAALFVAGLLGKESAIALVPVAAALAWTLRRSGDWLRRRRASFTAIGVAAMAWCAWRAWLRATGRDDVPLTLAHRGPAERLLRTARYAAYMTSDALFPVRSSPEYGPLGTASVVWLVGVAAFVALVVWLSMKRSLRAPAAGLAVALIAPLVTSPLLSPANERADRYVFVGSLGGAILWGAIADRQLARLPRRYALAILSAIALPLVVASHRAAAPFESDAALWRKAVERAPTSARAFAGLSRVRRLEGDLDGADQAVERALALDPSSVTARVTRIYNRLARGDVMGARTYIRDMEARGEQSQRGMQRAMECAVLAPADATRCIDGPRVNRSGR